MIITQLDIWLEKIRRGWKIEDVPNEEIKKELRKRLLRTVGRQNC